MGTGQHFYWIGLFFHPGFEKFVWLDGSSKLSSLFPWYNENLNYSCAGIWATVESKLPYPKGLSSIHTVRFKCNYKTDFICERAG